MHQPNLVIQIILDGLAAITVCVDGQGSARMLYAGMTASLKLCKVGALTTSVGSTFSFCKPSS